MLSEDILRSFGLKDEDKRKYKVVRDRYEAYFVKKRNVIYERAKFNLRKQEDGEPVDDFVTSLYSLAQYCNFGEWCAGMVVVPKADGKIRICVDFTKLNESVCRELHMLPCVEQILAQLSGAKVFSKLFWQVKLSESSSPLTTFITPFGRFRFQRLPFGITSAPEIFQRMSEILLGLDGVVCMMEDVLILGQIKKSMT